MVHVAYCVTVSDHKMLIYECCAHWFLKWQLLWLIPRKHSSVSGTIDYEGFGHDKINGLIISHDQEFSEMRLFHIPSYGTQHVILMRD